MSDNNVLTIWDMLLFGGVLSGIIYTFYMSWFRPAKFLERNVDRGLSPYYASSTFLWVMRIASTFSLLVILFIAYNFLRTLPNAIP